MRKTSLIVLVALTAMAMGAVARLWADPATTQAAADVGSDANPVSISPLPDAITIDGDPAKWDKIKALPAPYSKLDAGALKLAYRDDGLYGLVTVKDDKIAIDADNPWTADCVEIWLETDDAKADEMGDNSSQVALVPDPQAGAGKAKVVVPSGPINPDAVKAMWKPTADGYCIEFFIPVKEITPAKMQAGAKLGMHYAVDLKGKPVEEFYCEKDTDDSYKTPKNWGTIELAK